MSEFEVNSKRPRPVVPRPRAGRVTGRPWRSTLLAFLLALLVLGLGMASLYAWCFVRQDLWPWIDFNSPGHAVLHVVNDSDHHVQVGWRWAGSDRWNGMRRPGRLQGVGPRTSDYTFIFPLLPAEVAARPFDGDFSLPPGFTRDIVLRIDGSGFGSVERALAVGRHDHVQIRVTSAQRVLFARGGESWIGYPSLGDVVELTVP